ncbi:MAG: single-stranded DNA-binding protein [Lachnospiraceae bacterium]|jgi:single-strand DNA-binding protein
MNNVVLMGRLTRDPEVRYSNNGPEPMAIARYTLAVDRRGRRDAEQTADFIGCVSFGRTAEFIEKYVHKGTKIAVTGRIQTGRYTDKDGRTVFTTDVVAENVEFAESKAASESGRAAYQDSYNNAQSAPSRAPMDVPDDGFMNIPEGIDEELPFN